MRHLGLFCHPATPCPAVAGIDVGVALAPGGDLTLTYTLSGEIDRLAIPTSAAPARKDELWRHTCFEVFVMAGPGPAYREFNFAPSGDWAAYVFSGYRQGGAPAPMPAPAMVCRVGDQAIELEAHLPRLALPDGARLRLGLTAVVEDRDGRTSYWALRHRPGKPDFHQPDTFILDLEWT